MDNNEIGIGIYLDLKKAFDTVNHKILLDKMCHYGIRGIVHKWFTSYLNSRKQYTCIENHCSDVADVCFGVPQGSVLGPLLFLIYVNGNCEAVPNCKVKLYAELLMIPIMYFCLIKMVEILTMRQTCVYRN